jgi:hypothetical protein
VPFGYTADASGRLFPDAREQAILARAREMRASGATLATIVSDLAERGFVSRSGRPLGLTQVWRLVHADAGVSTMTQGHDRGRGLDEQT